MSAFPAITYNPFLPAVRRDPYPVYRLLRSFDPVHFNPYARTWFLTRYVDCAAVLRDPRFSASQGQQARRREDPLPVSMLTSDPPIHGRLREPANAAFAGRLADSLTGPVQRIAEDLLASGAPRDLLADFAAPLSVRTLALLLGVPDGDLARLHTWAAAASVNLDPFATPERVARASVATDELGAYLSELVTNWTGRADEVPDPVSPQLAAGLAVDEVASTLALLVIGGYEPLLHAIGNGAYTVLRQPDQAERLRAEPDLPRSAVDELIRFEPPIQLTARVALAEVTVGAARIEPGQTVVLLLGAANRDPAVFSEPERLDLDRAPNPHLGFGGGPHFCLGASLARTVVRVALGSLLVRYPGLRLDNEEPQWIDAVVPRGLTALHVRP